MAKRIKLKSKIDTKGIEKNISVTNDKENIFVTDDSKNAVCIPLTIYNKPTGIELFVGEKIKNSLIQNYNEFEKSTIFALDTFGSSAYLYQTVRKTKFFYFPVMNENFARVNVMMMETLARIWEIDKVIFPKFIYKEYNWMKLKKVLDKYNINYEFREVQ